MSDIDWSTVKAVTIPEGSVKKIDIDGVTVWERSESRLPSEYREVEYIEGTGEQYIDTGLIGAYTWTVNVAAQNVGTYTAGSTHYLCGSAVTATFRKLFMGIKNDAFVFESNAGEVSADIDVSTKHTYKWISGGCYVDGTRYGGYTIRAQSYHYLLFNASCGSNSPQSGKYFEGRVYSMSVQNSGTLILDLVPCYRKEDGEIGMYDLVSGTFFANSGTGTFSKGANV